MAVRGLIWSSPLGPAVTDCAAAGTARQRAARELAIKLTRRILGSGWERAGVFRVGAIAENGQETFRFCDGTGPSRPPPHGDLDDPGPAARSALPRGVPGPTVVAVSRQSATFSCSSARR